MGKNHLIVPVVEGDGDRYAVPDLVRNILWQCNRYDIGVAQSVVAKGKPRMLKQFKRLLRYALQKGGTAILVLLDADGRCPCEEVIGLVEQANALGLQVPVAVVCARNEYETWFICSLAEEKGTKIKDYLGLPKELSAPDNPEGIRNAKGWLTGHMTQDRAYQETADQRNLTHFIELDLVRERSRSFRRFWHALEELVYAVNYDSAAVTPPMN